jgi:SAM-dependent methyltransferase
MRNDSDMPIPDRSELPDVHLDLGCGTAPRNPYRRKFLCGVDIRSPQNLNVHEYKSANLFLDPIPWPANYFGSVSAFDFIEHVPRVLPNLTGGGTRFPFIELLNEVWRVLGPDGLFYALTPCYPSKAAFQDPTHVNIITEETHNYFCGAAPVAAMYGFIGRFSVRRAQWVIPEHSQTAERPGWRREWQRSRKARSGRLSYFLWELQADKRAASTG